MSKNKAIFILCCIFFVIGYVSISFFCFADMRDIASFKCEIAKNQIELRIEDTVDLLESLVDSETIKDDNKSYIDKAKMLTRISNRYGFMMIRIMDEDMTIYNENGKSANLASRDYIQELWKTGKVQVTDAFLAGADGKTVNYTIAVARMKNNEVNGSLFAAIYEDEFSMKSGGRNEDTVLVGKNFQLMSGAGADNFGVTLSEFFRNNKLIGTSEESVLMNIKNKISGSFWCLNGITPWVYFYAPIEQTNWTIVSYCSVWKAFRSDIAYGAIILIVIIGLFSSIFVITRVCKNKI